VAEQSWALSSALLDGAFPFHLVLDRELRVVQAGPSAHKMHPAGVVGLQLGELFDVATPKIPCTFDSFAAAPRSLFLLASRTRPGLLLRGQILHDAGADCLFFVGSPWMTETTAFASLGLTLHDFAASDAVVDYVLLLQNQTRALDEARALTTRLHETAEQLTHHAFHDSLTGLPNRARLLDHLQRRLQEPQTAGRQLAVLTLDLDGFKAVNDSYGHSAGDEVLWVVGNRLRSTARDGDLIARFGGDEFAFVLELQPTGGPVDEQAAVRVAERVLSALGDVVPLPSCPAITVPLSASIGIAYSGSGADTAEDLLRNADLAMYAAKASGKSRYKQFEPEMHVKSRKRLDLATQLGRAVEDQELRLVYQPILRLDGDRFAGAEALLRWQHPTRGLLGPLEFIELAEDTGLIVPIGAWVLDEACRELTVWQKAHTGKAQLGVAVNLSGRQFGPDLVTTVAEALATHGIDPGSLTLEITEGLITGDGPGAQETLRALKKLGVWLAIDDFGTGHSSLGRLRDYDFDELKIDRRFVSDLDTGDTTLVTTQIALAHGLEMGIVAEGVETEAQLQFLRAAGCGQVQGYLIARPLPAAEVRLLLAGRGEWVSHPAAGSNPETPRHSAA
jgi:diguanylate cyclase (GGDEF)-like protein